MYSVFFLYAVSYALLIAPLVPLIPFKPLIPLTPLAVPLVPLLLSFSCCISCNFFSAATRSASRLFCECCVKWNESKTKEKTEERRRIGVVVKMKREGEKEGDEEE